MTHWTEPAWDPDWLTPHRLYGGHDFVLEAAVAAQRGVAAAAMWDDRLPPAQGAADAWVLVGGAGFLGARIAARLLREPDDAPVVIISRRPEAIHEHWRAMAGAVAADRLMRHPRLRPIAVDITAADLAWTPLVARAAVVIHLAAAVHALAGWRRLAAVNLAGLRVSIALARRDDALLQLASTLSVFVSSNAARADVTAPMPDDPGIWLHGGYAQTKAAAESALVTAEIARWQVVRYGLLVPEAATPFPTGHFAPGFAAALYDVAALPDMAERAMVDLTPVGDAAAAAIRVARAGGSRFVHCANPEAASLAAMVAALAAAHGSLPVIAAAAWRARVDALPATPRTLLRAAFDKARFLREDAARGPVLNVDLFQSTHRRFVADDGGSAMPTPQALLPGLAAALLGAAG